MSGSAGFGATLSIDSTPIGSLTSITPPSMSADVIDVTAHDSSDGFREFVGGLRDGGEISAEGNHDAADAGQEAARDALDDGASHSIAITLPDGSSWACNGIVTKYESGAPMDDKLSFSIAIKVTGKPVFTGS